jgi:uncharacterized protein (DUF58 family)
MVFTLLASMLLVSFIFAFFYRPKLSVTRLIPDRTTCGQKIYPQIILQNNSHFPCYDIVLKDFSIPREIKSLVKEGYYIPVLQSKEEQSLKSGFEFLKRGDYNIPGLFAGTIFPFGIWTWEERTARYITCLFIPDFIIWINWKYLSVKDISPEVLHLRHLWENLPNLSVIVNSVKEITPGICTGVHGPEPVNLS